MDRQSRTITDPNDIKELVSITDKDITATFLYDTFGEFDGVAKYYPYDIITIPAGSYGPEGKKNKNDFTTTVGIWIYNKFFIEPDLFDIFHYVNKNITGGVCGDIDQQMAYALMEDRITVDQMKRYLMKTQFIMPFVSVLAPNHSEKMLTCTKVINKKKKELVDKYKDLLEAGDVKTINMVEEELLKFAEDYIGEDPSMDSYISGARANIDNHFKNMFVMKGAVRDSDPNAKQEYSVALSNYTDGISAEEYSLYSKSAVAGPYSRGKKTEYGGYMENLFTMNYQDVILDEPGTDCGTKLTSTVELTKKNVKWYMYNNIVTPSGDLVELNSQNMDKYIGKKVQMRFANLCKNQKICNACAGNFFYKLNVRNVGLSLMQVPSAFKNKAMKAFHDSTIQTTEMDVMAAFSMK